MRLQDRPYFENLIDAFDPGVVDEVNARIGQSRADAPRRLAFLDANETGEGPFSTGGSEGTGWFDAFAAAARLNYFSRAIWAPVRSVNSEFNRGTMEYNSGTTKINVDRWMSENEDNLKATPEGNRVLKNYIEGDYDDVDDAGVFLTLIGYDMETGNNIAKRSSGGVTANIAGSILDPALFAGGAFIRLAAGTTVNVTRGASVLNALRATRAASRARMASGFGGYLVENAAYGTGFSIFSEIAERTYGVDPEGRTMSDTIYNATVGLAGDVILSSAFFGIGRGINRAKGLKPLDAAEVRAKAEEAAKPVLDDAMSKTETFVDVAEVAVRQPVREPRTSQDFETLFDDLDGLNNAKTSIEADIAEMKARIRDESEGQGRLFGEEVEAVEGQTPNEALAARLRYLEEELDAVDQAIGNFAAPVRAKLDEGVVEVKRAATEDPDMLFGQDAEDGLFDRRVFSSKEEALASGYAGMGDAAVGFLNDQIANMPANERNALAQTLADPEVIESLRSIRDAISSNEFVPADTLNENVARALEAITARSPNLSFNPASFGVGLVQTVKIDQAIMHATTVGWVPTTPIEDLIMALKQLGGFDQLPGGASGRASAPAPTPGGAGGAGGSGRGGGRRVVDGGVPASVEPRYRAIDDPNLDDLALDLTNDQVQKAVKAAREAIAKTPGLKSLAKGEDEFSGIGIQAVADQLGSGLGYSASDNRYTSALYNVLFESPYSPKFYTRAGVNLPDNFRVPLERSSRSIKTHSDNVQAQLLKSFDGLRKSLGRNPRTNTPGLMSSEGRSDLARFYSMLEELRVYSESAELRFPTEPLHSDVLLAMGDRLDDPIQVVRKYFPEAAEDALPLVMRAVDRLREPLPSYGRGRLAELETRSLRDNATSILINEDVSLLQAVNILRRTQNLAPVESLSMQNLDESLTVFRDLTDGRRPEIEEADIAAAIANAGGAEEEFLRNRVINLWNRRLNGTIHRDTALRMLADEQTSPFLRLDARASLQAARLQATRAEMMEKLVDYMLYMQRMEQLRPGQSANARTAFSEMLGRYDELLEDFAILRNRGDDSFAFNTVRTVDKHDAILSDMIDTVANFAARNSERFVDEKATVGARRREAERLSRQASNLGELIKNQVGFITEAPTDRLLERLGNLAFDASRTTLLSRAGISMAVDMPNSLAKSLAVGMSRTLGRNYFRGLTRSLRRVPEEQRPEMMKLLTAYHDNALHNLAQSYDYHFTDLDPATDPLRQSTLDRAVDKSTAFVGGPVSKAGFIASGGAAVDLTMRQAGTLQALDELTSGNGLIVRLAQAFESLEEGQPLLEGLKSIGQDGNYGAYQHVLRYLSRDDINVLAEAIKSKRYEVATAPGKLGGDTRIEFLAPVQEGADEATRTAQKRAMRSLAALTDSWVEFRFMTAPHLVDRPRARKGAGNFFSRLATQFMSAGMAASRTIVLQTGNDSLGRRAFFVGTAIAAAMAVRYLRSVIRGDTERYMQELEEAPAVLVADAIGWSGVLGVVGDKGMSTLASIMFGENAYDTRRNLEFATTTPLQSYASRGFSAFLGAKKLAQGEELTPFEKRAMRSVFSFGLLDSLTADFALWGADSAGADDVPGVGDTLDFIYGDILEKRNGQQ